MCEVEGFNLERIKKICTSGDALGHATMRHGTDGSKRHVLGSDLKATRPTWSLVDQMNAFHEIEQLPHLGRFTITLSKK